jgi:hypothetical protein
MYTTIQRRKEMNEKDLNDAVDTAAIFLKLFAGSKVEIKTENLLISVKTPIGSVVYEEKGSRSFTIEIPENVVETVNKVKV